MDADRAALKALADQRGAIEAEMAAVAARLNAPGMPGEKSPLVDAEARATRASACTSHTALRGWRM